jgi:glucose-1-phosphate thymidylyltransferase
MSDSHDVKIRGVVLAGGTGSRLMPLTKVTNKHLLPVGEEPMIYYPIKRLVTAGITEIMIVTGLEHMGAVVNLLGSGREFGAEFTYRVQDEAGGIAQALGLARHFAAGQRLAVILGDNIFASEITEFVESFRQQEKGARILLKEVPDPNRFGVAEIDGERIVSIEEKPAKPKSNLAVIGVYLYDNHVFETIDRLKPSQRGELEISDVNSDYLERGELCYNILPGWWTDAGTHPSLFRANQLVRGLAE